MGTRAGSCCNLHLTRSLITHFPAQMSKGGMCEADLRKKGIVESSSAGTYSSIEKVLTLPHERVATHVTAYLEGGLPHDRHHSAQTAITG